MGVLRVTLTAAEEQHAPPAHEIDVVVAGDMTFITVYDGSDEDVPSTKKLAYEVPPIKTSELVSVIGLQVNDAGLRLDSFAFVNGESQGQSRSA